MEHWKWNGARWWKLDFHTHTRESDDYGKGPDQRLLKQRSLEEWLLDYMRAEIDCVVVTDHNTGAAIDLLKAALRRLEQENDGFRELTLFPGVEISVNGGVHVLAILNPGATMSTIDRLLGAVECQAPPGSTDGETKKSLVEVLQAITKEGGVAVPAHVDRACGLFRLRGLAMKQAFESGEIFAMELVDPDATKPALYRDLKLGWTEVLGSDAHHPVGEKSPGSRFTWVKMGTPTIEGLRLALLDGPLSVRRSDTFGADPNEHAAKVIESIEVRETCYMGRSRPFKMTLNPWLNAVIGGRGTGKSTLVELLRLALRREDELDELPKAMTEDFKKYRTVSANRSDDGLLKELSEIVVTYRKDGSRFRVQWSQAGTLEPIEEQDAAGRWRPIAGEIRRHFPARIYSQKQIFELAKAPQSLLRIIDEDMDRQDWDERWNEEHARFLSLRATAREIEGGLAEEPRVLGDLGDTKRLLSIFEQAGHADVLRAYQDRQRQRRVVEGWEGSWSEMADRLRELAEQLVPDELASSLAEVAEKDVLESAGSAVRRLEAIRDRLMDLATEADRALGEWRQSRDTCSWNRAVNGAFAAYSALSERLEEEGAGDPGAYGELVQRCQALEERIATFSNRRQQLERIRRDAESSLKRLQQLRRELTHRRSRFLTETLSDNPYVRIEVLAYGDREGFESNLRGILDREEAFKKDLGDLLENLYSGPGEAREQRLSGLKERIRGVAALEHGPGEVRDQRFARRLSHLPPEAMDRVDSLFPDDSLDVQYSSSDRGRYRPIHEGSPGQRTAALLAYLLLSHGEEPIILDQPEDDLDNQLIYDLIVTQLRQIKLRRQVIVVTHNANIVVNGDAELVIALAARGGETHRDSEGSLQQGDVRQTICDIMEGGREAFDRRYRRIALEGRSV